MDNALKYNACEVCRKQLYNFRQLEIEPHVVIVHNNKVIARYCVDCFNSMAPLDLIETLKTKEEPKTLKFLGLGDEWPKETVDSMAKQIQEDIDKEILKKLFNKITL
jgi:hypothetical protein